MARPGVTYQEVVNAAIEVKGKGKNPTIENIRAVLGTGSIGTINMHLRKWKASQNQTEQLSIKENLPEELISLLKGLWERVVQTSEERVTQLEENYQKTLSEMTAELEKYKKNNQRWQQLYNQWLQEKTQILNEKLTLEQAIQLFQKDMATLTQQNDALQIEQKEKQERIDELNRLHKQLQENLEHYRNAAREQRLMDQENFDRQKQELQTQLKNQQIQINVSNEKVMEIEKKYHLLEQKYDSLEKTHDQISSQYEDSRVTMQKIEKEFLQETQMNQHWQSEYKKAQLKIESITLESHEKQLEVKVSLQKIQSIQKELEDIRAQNQLISHDKWMISQEKAQLEGQLKQLQQMFDAQLTT
jgi:chromosome segregation ATPase